MGMPRIVIPLPSEGRGHRFKSCRVRQHAILKKLREHRAGLFRRKSTAVLMALLLLPQTTQAAEPPTIASTSLCGDSYLLALAPNNITALSWQSRSPLSLADKDQRELPQLWDDPEVLINTKADIILFGSGEGKFSGGLKPQSVKLTWGEDFSIIEQNAHAIAEALAIPTHVTEAWGRRIDALKTRENIRPVKPKILYLSRSGGSAGSGTLVDSAIIAAGGVNVVTSAGWFTPDPENIISYEPDLIITSYFKNGYESVQSTAVRNKVVQRYIAQHPSVEIDGKYWPCAGPGLIDAAERIADAIDKLP